MTRDEKIKALVDDAMTAAMSNSIQDLRWFVAEWFGSLDDIDLDQAMFDAGIEEEQK